MSKEDVTLRDYFAARIAVVVIDNWPQLTPLKMARDAYQYADAMIQVRELKKQVDEGDYDVD